MDIRMARKFSASACRSTVIQLDRINLAEPILVHIQHVRVVCSGFHQDAKIESGSKLGNRSLLYQMRGPGSGDSAKFPRKVFAPSRNAFVKMEKPCFAESLP